MRKRSALVALGALMAMGCVAGCDDEPPTHSKACVDEETMRRVDDDDCDDPHRATFIHWFYMPASQPVPAVGATMDRTQGSFTAPAGARAATVSRSGFGGRAGGGSGS